MKTLLTFALAGLLATSSFAANENEDLMALSNVNARFKHVDVYLKDGVGKAKIAIMNEDGKVLHRRKVKVDQDLRVPYNLDYLPSGEYSILISTEEEEVMYTVNTVEEEKAPIEYPLVAYGRQIGEETINLSVIGLVEPGVEVTIRSNRSNRILLQETVMQEEGFKKSYKLVGIAPEDVYLHLKDAQGRTKTLYF